MLEVLILLVTKVFIHFTHPAFAPEDSGESQRLRLCVYTQSQAWEIKPSKQK